MISAAGAHELLAIADELRRVSLVDRRDPERPYVIRDELARRICETVQDEMLGPRSHHTPASRSKDRPRSSGARHPG